jgi:hypothetical protein
MPLPKRRNPMGPALLAILAVAVLAVAGLVIAGFSAQPDQVAYANDEYQVHSRKIESAAADKLVL